jgi:hypothetical protein
MNTQLAVKERRRLLVAELSREANELMVLGRDRFWRPEYMGLAPVPYQSVRMGDWLVGRSIHDTSPVPERAQLRIRDVYAAGIRPKDWLIAHEICHQLKAPEPTEPIRAHGIRERIVGERDFSEVKDQLRVAMHTATRTAWKTADKVAPVAWEVTKAAAKVTAGVVVISAVGLATVLSVALMAAASIDPLLIAVIDSGGDPAGDHWILIDQWDLPA